MSHWTEAAALTRYFWTTAYNCILLNHWRPCRQPELPSNFVGSVPRSDIVLKKILAKMPNKKLHSTQNPIVGSLSAKNPHPNGIGQARFCWWLCAVIRKRWNGTETGIDIAEGWGDRNLAVGCVPYKGRPVRFALFSANQRREFRIEDDEEIPIKCPSVMMGYHKDEAKTAEPLAKRF